MSLPLLTRAKAAVKILLGREIPASSRLQTSRDLPALTSEEIAEARSFFPMDKFFIFGHARSGTTMLTRLIRLHPQVHCNYQAHFFTRAPLLQALVTDPDVAEWLARPSNRWNRGGDLSTALLRAAADFILERDARQAGKSIVGDKSPNSLLDGEAVRLMHKIYPDARLIYIVRDGRDAALSHRFQAFIDKTEHLSQEDLSLRQAFAQDPQPFLRGERSIFTEKAIRQAAEGWARNVSETHENGRAYYSDRYIYLRYESLLQNPWEEMQRIWTFLRAGLSAELGQAIRAEMEHNPDADWQRQKAREIAEPLQKGKRGAWREIFTDRDRSIFTQIAGDVLTEWGYAER